MNFLVTGGASGLGAAIVKKLAAIVGHHIYFTFSSSAEAAAKIEHELKNTTAIQCNFSDQNSVQKLVEQIPGFQISILVNNAVSFMLKDHFHKINANDFLSSFSQNVMPSLQITQACISSFRKQKFGKIINIASSVIINKPPIGWSEYAANKAYLVSMSNSWATENIKFNITSNCISPSFMQTALTSNTDERLVADMVQNHPLKKLLSVKEVADVVEYFSLCTQHINGVNLVMNAGADIY